MVLSNYIKDPIFWLLKINIEFLLLEIYLFYVDSFTLSQLFSILLGNIALFAIIYMVKEVRDLNQRLKRWLKI